MITRRRAVIGLGMGSRAASLGSFAQERTQGATRIGVLPLGSRTSSYNVALVDALRQGLREVGIVENRNVTIDVAWVENESEYPKAVNDLLQRSAKILVPAGTSASVEAKRRTSAVPIVFTRNAKMLKLAVPESMILRAD